MFDSDRSAAMSLLEADRVEALQKEVQDTRSVLNVDALLVRTVKLASSFGERSISNFFSRLAQDAVAALVSDCNFPSLRRNKNVENFLNRCECTTKALEELLLQGG